jgi:hypothetical protein
MIKWIVLAGAVGAGFAFAAGAYVGWKTTLKVIDSYDERRKKEANAS